MEFFIDIKSFRLHCGPGVSSASNRNEYQEHVLGVKAAVHKADNLPPSCAIVMKSGNPLDHSRPATGLLYLFTLCVLDSRKCTDHT